MLTVKTYLPIFSGYYNNPYWDTDSDEESEVDNINEIRAEKGWAPIIQDELEFDYEGHNRKTAEKISNAVAKLLSDYVHSIEFEKLISPRYYDHTNDSINVIISPKIDVIKQYLLDNSKLFEDYLKKQYTSYDGFISSYANNTIEFMMDSPFEHKHKLGSILDFIAENEDISEEDVHSLVEDNNLFCTNFDDLTENENN